MKSFRDATLAGWEYAFSHIDETVELIYKKYNTQHKSKKAYKYEAQELKKLAYFKTDKIGKLEKRKFEKIYDIYKLLGFVDRDIDFQEIIYNERLLGLQLTKQEKEYLKKRQGITMCIDPNWMPFEQFDENGVYDGMTADYYKLFAKILETEFKVIPTKNWTESIEFAKERKCDIFSLAMETPKRKEYMNFTTPYLKIPLVVATKLDVPFINEIKDITEQKVGISKGYAFVELLRNKYPNLEIVEVDDIDDGLDRVNSGELFGYIGTLASVGYKFQTKYS
ncbi:MAG: transporter substrate-binding domain-containing protein, partial [Sulfurimonas sp.]